MKKWFVIMMVLILAVVCLTGCSKDEDKSSSSSAQKTTDAPAVKETKTEVVPSKNVGDVVIFGQYEQDNNPDNGSEPIEWIVLDVQDGKTLLLSKYALDTVQYNKDWIDMTWEKCSLRTWLNTDFLGKAFNEQEQSAVLMTQVDNSDAQRKNEYNTTSGKNTDDRVFLLSHHEAFDLYFTSDEARMCVPTDYAIGKGAGVSDECQINGRATASWWLRSPAGRQHMVSCVFNTGSDGTYSTDDSTVVVRPALWVNRDSGI